MKYENIVSAKFISRPNRFIAMVELIESGVETEPIAVHVKNTGRCRELLLPGVTVYLQKAMNENRKTPYDLIAVESPLGIINIDSQAPNVVVNEWLKLQDYDVIIPEKKYGNSRIDFYMEKGDDCYFMEVKGCTLIKDGIGYFPDAPTERGAKHLKELTEALDNGYKTIIAFVIPVNGITQVRPNSDTDPAFAEAYENAIRAGVEVQFLQCRVTADSLEIID